MKINLRAFGIARDIFGSDILEVDAPENITVGELRLKLNRDWPALVGLASVMFAVDHEYATDDCVIQAESEVALIPPVAGG